MEEEKLSLGSAVRLVSEHLPVADVRVAILQAEGALPANLDDCRSYRPGQWNDLAYPGEAVQRRHPWLQGLVLCPWCTEAMRGAEIVTHPVNEHVGDEINFEDEADWLDEMEEGGEEVARNGLAVYFHDPSERTNVMLAARHQGLTLNAYMAAALRMVLRHDLCVHEFVSPDPPEAKAKC